MCLNVDCEGISSMTEDYKIKKEKPVEACVGKGISVSRDDSSYHIRNPSKKEYHLNIAFKDKKDHVMVQTCIPHSSGGKIIQTEYINKKTGRKDVGYGGVFEPEDTSEERHIHKIVQNCEKDREIYKSIIEGLNKHHKINGDCAGDLLHSFHKQAEKEFYNEIDDKYEGIEIIDISEEPSKDVDFEITAEYAEEEHKKRTKK